MNVNYIGIMSQNKFWLFYDIIPTFAWSDFENHRAPKIFMSLAPELNSGPPMYDARILATQSWSSVNYMHYHMTIDGVRISESIYWPLHKLTSRDYTLQITDSHRLVSAVYYSLH
jgi:hypothetical protein